MNRRAQVLVRNATFQGPAGAAGPTGATGAQGIQGPTGPAGVAIVAYNTANSATLTNVTAATSFSLSYALPANFLTVGKILRVKWGVAFTPGAAQNVTLEPRIGGQGLANPAYATTAQNYEAEAEHFIICRSTGVAGVIQAGTKWLFMAEAGGTPQVYGFPAPGTLTIDTTSAQTIDLQWTSTVANSTAVVRSFTVEAFN